MASSWREFWNGDHAIYVNAAHKTAHSKIIIDDILTHIKTGDTVLDFGCGEMPSLEPLVNASKQLILCDGAESVLNALNPRIKPFSNVSLALPEQLKTLKPTSIDKIFVVSVVQYLSLSELEMRLAEFKTLLKPSGALFLADIIPPNVGIIEDTKSLLTFALKNGFFIMACLGLVKTLFSPYRKLRADFGLTKFSQAELKQFVEKNGFKAEILAHNIGPHQHRFTAKITL